MSRDPAGEVDKQRLLVNPVLRLVSSLTSLVDSSDFLEVILLYCVFVVFSCSNRI